ncbi:tannase/feruloyl esterase family alpha/beta hydrolase [Vibrio sp. 10N.261.46.E12]|uniref:tannase/feruloyl esterase family alpha/beta hydrolase n=1 Tax=unclassified Vibrio TaxID=2614977 RepID=UPI000978A604|nr:MULTISPECIES: tannase/feruloyl esterase family alpha/beta hydrolase [unclassified Vibrio]OMO35060.1 hypothetical protein BH584_10635 [Vibrio sp. 10N.261.45.E1]PMJ36247.1 hypothetical protein BCU27_23335 [Vibrio sp. 10N.286.45.B6]PML96136.1 hypothetical protein BCT66_22290 [Vibrio sp. 10N.261.49.E11]PMM68423.1 hypothetical protein BCT48_11700 [Vibrio sp. 10N.261.46.F12]PMM80277.1 hypothetical protein BCT46_18310 [Vibrio sp. 10N.261.46.E8]
MKTKFIPLITLSVISCSNFAAQDMNTENRVCSIDAMPSSRERSIYYSEDIQRNLFFGCSRGGCQGVIAAQRFPTDYDVIVAGSPVYDWTRALAGHITAV